MLIYLKKKNSNRVQGPYSYEMVQASASSGKLNDYLASSDRSEWFSARNLARPEPTPVTVNVTAGKSRPALPAKAERKKMHAITFLLWLFFGGLGAQHWYRGHTIVGGVYVGMWVFWMAVAPDYAALHVFVFLLDGVIMLCSSFYDRFHYDLASQP